MDKIGAIEAGGTKMVLAVCNKAGSIIERREIPTTEPSDCLPKIIAWFKGRNIGSLGIGAFGPTCVNPKDPRFGQILDTPKVGWRHFNFLNALSESFHVPIGYDTDVNAACLGEVVFGAAKGLDHVVYVTVGTGIGVGVMVRGHLLHGMLHPEAGHIRITKEINDTGKSVCPYHSDCLEGLASGPSIESRWGNRAENLAKQFEVWDLESSYLAKGLATYILCYSPQRIILGGGVMYQKQLFPLIRRKVLESLGGYISTPEIHSINNYIIPPGCHGDQGILGAVELARQACDI
jgi:fructokinase